MAAYRHGFTLVDAAATIAAAGVCLAVATAAASGSRSAARRDFCAEKLGRLGQSSAAFAAANQGIFAGLTWARGGANSAYTDINDLQAQGNVQAHAAEATDWLRRGGLTDMPVNGGWIADVNFWTVAISKLEGRPITDAFNVCPSDDVMNKIRRNPDAFRANLFVPAQPVATGIWLKEAFRSSYTASGSAMDRLQSIMTPEAVQSRIQHGGTHKTYVTWPNPEPGPSAMSIVAFPSQKAQAFDAVDRHFAPRPIHFGYAQARGQILFFDGSVRVRSSGEAITPWQPRTPDVQAPQAYEYEPWTWEPPTLSGQPAETVTDKYRWTRDGLLGQDFAQ